MFALSIGIGVAICFAWLGIWALMLRAFGVPIWTSRPEEREAYRQRIIRLGRLRYVLVFGIFGIGFGLGFAIATSIVFFDPSPHAAPDWMRFVGLFVVVALTAGLIQGTRNWNENFREAASFPPRFLAPK